MRENVTLYIFQLQFIATVVNQPQRSEVGTLSVIAEITFNRKIQ